MHHFDNAAWIFHELQVNGCAKPVLNPDVFFPMLIINIGPVKTQQYALLSNAQYRIFFVNEQFPLRPAYKPSFFLSQPFST
jgi:hypothetical protein